LVTELPAEAYGEVMNAFKANPAGSGGIKPESIETSAGLAYYTAENAKDGATSVRRYSMILPGGTFSGYVAVQIPENATKIYTDDAVRQMFASAVIRKQVPVEEQLGLMPFKISELSDFKNIRTLAPGAAIILADGDEVTGFEPAPFMVIGLIGATPARTRYALSEARRATNGRKRFHASAPCATEFSRADNWRRDVRTIRPRLGALASLRSLRKVICSLCSDRGGAACQTEGAFLRA
jgi:hypothetical protein